MINFVVRYLGFEILPIPKKKKKKIDVSLIELGKMLSNPIGKSGVNYRLKAISNFAEELKRCQ